jgi:hypothetical protein
MLNAQRAGPRMHAAFVVQRMGISRLPVFLNTGTADEPQTRRDPDLLLRRRRATHVMGSQGLEVPSS